jgi:hypothetical protein
MMKPPWFAGPTVALSSRITIRHSTYSLPIVVASPLQLTAAKQPFQHEVKRLAVNTATIPADPLVSLPMPFCSVIKIV